MIDIFREEFEKLTPEEKTQKQRINSLDSPCQVLIISTPDKTSRQNAGFGRVRSLADGCRLVNHDAQFGVAFGSVTAVAVFWMCLFDVGAIEIDAVFVGAVDFVQAHGLITKWGSRIGPHQQSNRPAPDRGQPKHLSGALALGI